MGTGALMADLRCVDCGSNVTTSDRFCPACGTPNSQTKFHPKFGPEIIRFEPEVVTDEAPAGTACCPRCAREIEQAAEFCRACGMDLDGAWARFDRARVLDEWRRENRWTMARFQAVQPMALIVQIILYLGVGLAAAVGVLDVWLLVRVDDSLLVGPRSTELLRVRDGAELAAAVLLVVGGVLLVLWMRRAYANLTALAVGHLRYKPVWVVAGWLVPGLNLVRPKQIVDDLFRASDRDVFPFASTWRSRPTSMWSHVWWGGLLLGGALGLAGHSLITTNAARAVSEATDLRIGLAVSALAAFLLAVAALGLSIVVHQINERQVDRADLVAHDGLALYAVEMEESRRLAQQQGSTNSPFAFDAKRSALVHHGEGKGLWGRY